MRVLNESINLKKVPTLSQISLLPMSRVVCASFLAQITVMCGSGIIYLAGDLEEQASTALCCKR